jgi:hypothetical protein
VRWWCVSLPWERLAKTHPVLPGVLRHSVKLRTFTSVGSLRSHVMPMVKQSKQASKVPDFTLHKNPPRFMIVGGKCLKSWIIQKLPCVVIIWLHIQHNVTFCCIYMYNIFCLQWHAENATFCCLLSIKWDIKVFVSQIVRLNTVQWRTSSRIQVPIC